MSELAKQQETAVVVHETTSIMQVISRAASDPNTDVNKLERMMAMYERMEAKKAEAAFYAAMTAAQMEMRRVGTDAVNPQTRSKYATYGALDKALRPIYSGHGFSLSFDTDDSPKPEHIRVLCYVSHEAGHSRTYKTDMPADGKGAKGGDAMTKTHAAGAAMSYGMRYLLKMIFNVAVGEDDTDGTPPIEWVSPEQVAEIRRWIDKVGADEKAFCKYLQAQSVERIRASEYDRAIAALKRKANV